MSVHSFGIGGVAAHVILEPFYNEEDVDSYEGKCICTICPNICILYACKLVSPCPSILLSYGQCMNYFKGDN